MELDGLNFSMMAGMGYAPIKQFAIGVALSMATGVYLGTNFNVTPAQNPHVSANFPAQIVPIIGGIVGVTVTPLEDWRLGLVYRSETYGVVNIKADTQFYGDSLAAARIEGFLAYSPHQIALGSSYLLQDKWLFSADMTYYFWSNYPGPFLQIDSTGGAIAPSFKIASIEPPNFSNILVPRAGVEYNIWDKVKVRVGYSYRQTPAPEPAGLSKLIDASAHRISLGAGYEFQLYQNIFLTADAFFAADILASGRGSAINTGVLIGAEYD
jgi:long-subunit fatty acid transport protein